MRSGEHDLWDAFLATGRARADLRQASTPFAILAEQARRNFQALANAAKRATTELARSLERTR